MDLDSQFLAGPEPSSPTAASTDAAEDNLSFIGECQVLRQVAPAAEPVAASRASKLLYVDSIALAPFQVNFIPGGYPPIADDGDIVLHGLVDGHRGLPLGVTRTRSRLPRCVFKHRLPAPASPARRRRLVCRFSLAFRPSQGESRAAAAPLTRHRLRLPLPPLSKAATASRWKTPPFSRKTLGQPNYLLIALMAAFVIALAPYGAREAINSQRQSHRGLAAGLATHSRRTSRGFATTSAASSSCW